jgi:hypothetical protein
MHPTFFRTLLLRLEVCSAGRSLVIGRVQNALMFCVARKKNCIGSHQSPAHAIAFNAPVRNSLWVLCLRTPLLCGRGRPFSTGAEIDSFGGALVTQERTTRNEGLGKTTCGIWIAIWRARHLVRLSLSPNPHSPPDPKWNAMMYAKQVPGEQRQHG